MTPLPVPTRFSLAGRSMHRWLVGIPVVLFIATLVSFAVYAAGHDAQVLRAALLVNVAAVVSATAAAVFGLADFREIPSDHPAKKVGIMHGLLNGASVILLAANLCIHEGLVSAALRGRPELLAGFDPTTSLALAGVVVGLTLISGALGFRMAQHDRVGSVPVAPIARPIWR